jgi:peptidoglycan L-alanyl-D-glutamate endopeptidase CwlK
MTAVVERAIQLTEIDFGVTQGVRSLDEQKANVAAGRSQTMRSKHLLQDDGFSHAVDVVAYVGPDVSWELNLYDDI